MYKKLIFLTIIIFNILLLIRIMSQQKIMYFAVWNLTNPYKYFEDFNVSFKNRNLPSIINIDNDTIFYNVYRNKSIDICNQTLLKYVPVCRNIIILDLNDLNRMSKKEIYNFINIFITYRYSTIEENETVSIICYIHNNTQSIYRYLKNLNIITDALSHLPVDVHIDFRHYFNNK